MHRLCLSITYVRLATRCSSLLRLVLFAICSTFCSQNRNGCWRHAGFWRGRSIPAGRATGPKHLIWNARNRAPAGIAAQQLSGMVLAGFWNSHMDRRGLRIGALAPATEAGSSDHVWSSGEMCVLLPEASFAAKRIDKNLTLKALDTESTRREGRLTVLLFMSALSNYLDMLLHWLESIGLQPPSQDVRILEI